MVANPCRHALPEGYELVGVPVLGELDHEDRLARIAEQRQSGSGGSPG